MSTQLMVEDFSTLKNAIDSQLEIIRHDDTGFYNITKTAKMVAKILKSNESTISGANTDVVPIGAGSLATEKLVS